MRFRLLGEVEVHAHGRSVGVGHARQQQVLVALLVNANRMVTVDQLVERVWADEPPAGARSTLYSYVSRLRQVVSGIERRPGGYVLAVEPPEVDLHLFRELVRAEKFAEALALWRGEPFAGLDHPWLAALRETLRAERLAAQVALAEERLRRGEHDGLVAELAALAGEHPLDERVAGQYLLALHRTGRAADALEHYHQLRTRLADELGTDPGAPLRELHQRILTDDPALHVAKPRPVLVPRQLPAPPAPFVGRDDELIQLDGVRGTVVISAIAGTGGIGKTWLALHWAHRHADRFPDGQLFVDLRGFSPDGEPMAPAVAVRGFLDALGVPPSRVPADPHAQAALFRSLVADRRLLLVIDNAVDTDHVTSLLPGGGTCTVLVTSRNRLLGLVTGHGAHHVSLDVLTDDEARDLLAGRLGANRVADETKAVDELIALCGGFPLALSIIAGRARTQPHLTLASLAAELHDLGLGALDDDDPAASLPTVLSWSHRSLAPDLARAFAQLAAAPGPDISLSAAAALLGVPSATARITLRGLAQASLLTQDSSGRFRMHDLIRRYAAGSDPSSDLEALHRVVDFYLHTAHAGYRLLDPMRPPVDLGPPVATARLADEAAALAWFTAEHACLLAAQQTAMACGWPLAAWQLARTLTTFHWRGGHRDDDLAVWRIALAAADDLDDPAAQTLAHRLLGQSLTRNGRPHEGLEHLRRALELSERIADLPQQALNHRALGWLHTSLGDGERAFDHAVAALAIYQRDDDLVGRAFALNSVGWYAAKLGRYAVAREHCEAALALNRSLGATDGEAATLDSLGYLEHHDGDHTRAVEHYRRALALYRELGDAYETANTLDNLGHPHAALGQVTEARTVWREAAELFRTQDRDHDADRVRRQLDSLGS